MNRKKYVAPAIDIIIMQTEGMIAASNNHQPSIPIKPGKEITDPIGINSIETEEPTSFDLNDN